MGGSWKSKRQGITYEHDLPTTKKAQLDQGDHRHRRGFFLWPELLRRPVRDRRAGLLRAVKKSKVAETEGVMYMMANHAADTYRQTCTFPDAMPATSDAGAHCGGAKTVIDEAARSRLEQAGVMSPAPEYYFAYSSTTQGDAASSVHIVRAESDFSCGNARHTIEVRVQGTNNNGTCEATVQPSMTTNDFK